MKLSAQEYLELRDALENRVPIENQASFESVRLFLDGAPKIASLNEEVEVDLPDWITADVLRASFTKITVARGRVLERLISRFTSTIEEVEAETSEEDAA